MDASLSVDGAEWSRAVVLDWLRVVFTTTKCNWGIGMMAMPYFLLESGLGAGIILFVVAMWLSWLAIIRLSDCRKIIRNHSKDSSAAESEAKENLLHDQENSFDLLNYSDIVRAVMGDFFGDISIISILIAMYGSNISYIVFIKENMAKFVGLHGWEWILIAFAPLTGLVLKSDLKFLAPVSAFGLTCSFSFLFLVVYRVTSEVSGQQFHHTMSSAPFFSLSTFPIGLGIASFCNEGLVVMSPTIEEGMKWKRNYRSALLASVFSLTAIYLLFAISGFLLYYCPEHENCAHDQIQGALTQNFSQNTLSQIAVVLYALQLLFTYALVYFVCYNEVETRYYNYYKITAGSEAHTRQHRVFLAWRVVFMLLSGVIAMLVPKFGDFLALLGSLGNSLSIYILPNMCYLKLHANHNLPSWKQYLGGGAPVFSRLLSLTIVLAGIGACVIGVYFSMKQLLAD